MLRRNLFAAATVPALSFVTGCGPSIQADLSRDGRFLVQTDSDGLTLRKLDGGPSRRLLKGSAAEPKLSPDGRTVVVERYRKTGVDVLLVDVSTRATTTMGGNLRGPFAWRPDGEELIAWQGAVGCVYNLKRRQIVRRVSFPEKPRKVSWLGGDRGVVAASARRIMVLEKGRLREIPAKAEIADLEYDPRRDRIVWSEIRQMDPLRARMSVLAIPRTSGARVVLMKERDLSQVVGAESAFAAPISLSISPDGGRLAFAALIEAAPVGAWQRLVDLERESRRNPENKALVAELRRRQQALRVDLTITTAPIGGTATTVVRRRLSDMEEMPSELVWSAKGDRLALVADHGVQVVQVK